MNIELRDERCMPTRGSARAAGYDLKAAIDEPVTIHPGDVAMIPTGIRIALPCNYFGALYPRSGISTRCGLRLADCVGVIDEDYRGEVCVPLYNDSAVAQTVEPYERIAQLVIQPYFTPLFEQVLHLQETDRGAGGFGSTGTK